MALGRGYALPFIAGKQGGGGAGGAYGLLWQEAINANVPPLTAEDFDAGQGSCLFTRGQSLYDAVTTKPSLLIVPQMRGSGKLAVDIPSPVFFDVTRATTATRVNSSGLIESVASGVPRLDWYATPAGQDLPATGCPALLVEPSATNLVLQSRNLSVSGSWSASGITAVRNGVGADGTASGACTLTATAASGTILQNLSHASQSRVFSAVMRRVSGSGEIQLTTNGGTNWTAVTLTTQFIQLACTAQTVASGQVGIRMIASGDVIEVDFTQGEVGPIATSPIATTTAAVTRNADVISASGALVSGLIGQTEGTIYVEVDIRNMAKETHLIRIDDGATANVITLRTLTSNVIRTAITAPTTSGTLNISSAAFTAGIVKIAFAYKSGEIALSVNGATALTANGTFAFGASFNRITLGSNQSASSEFNDRIRAAALYTTRLTNDDLQTLTT